MSSTTFATIARLPEFDSFQSWDNPPHILHDVYEVSDRETRAIAILETKEELDEFRELDVGVKEFNRYTAIKEQALLLKDCLPDQRFGEAISTALQDAAYKQVMYIRSKRLSGEL